MWEIIDDNGVIYGGTQDDMTAIFQTAHDDDNFTDWDGDLKLVEVHDLIR